MTSCSAKENIMYGSTNFTISDVGTNSTTVSPAISVAISPTKAATIKAFPVDNFAPTEVEPAAVAAPVDKIGSDETSANKGDKQARHLPIKKILLTSLLLGLLAVGGVSGYHAFNNFMSHQETDDAYTTGHQHQISSRINDTVQQVLVDDNEHVKKGQVLAILDPSDFQVREAQALASLELAQHQAEAAKTNIVLASTTATGKSTEAEAGVVDAQAALHRYEAALLEAQAAVPKAEAELRAKEAEETRAKADGKRFVVLANQGAVSFQQRDSAIRDYEVAKSTREAANEMLKQTNFKLEQALQAVKSARAQVSQSHGLVEQAQATHVQTAVNEKQFNVAQAAIHQAEAQLRDARLQLSYTKIVAPVDGRIGKKIVEAGQRVQPGQQLMTVVADDIWVVANFKETQLEKMRPHQAVEIKVDSFPHHNFYGTVDSVSPGSGASFALLPPDNATGNFTKIVQRVPVKIRFDRASTRGYENLLVPGMSAVVSVDIKDSVRPDDSALAGHKDENQTTVDATHSANATVAAMHIKS
jgi:membrane fusion protein (multidrug efflux system)